MAQIIIQNLFEKIVKVTSSSQTLLRAFQEQGIDWMYACGGKGRCTTCKFIILAGEDNLSPMTDSEKKYKLPGALGATERLACQVTTKGDLCISVPEEYKLPHVHYSD